MFTRKNSKSSKRAFSYAELITVIGAIVVISGIAIPIITVLRDRTYEKRIDSNVASLNTAVNLYLSNGGEIRDDQTLPEVINKLKSVSTTDSERVVGSTGPFIDLRLKARKNEREPVGVKWDAAAGRFVMDRSDSRFEIFLADQPDAVIREDREAGAVEWGDDWVWEYADDSMKDQLLPTQVSLTPQPVPRTIDVTGPVVTVTALTNETLSVEANDAVNPGFEYNNGFEERNRTFGRISRGPVAFNTLERYVEGWQTTASDDLIEIWFSGFRGVESYSGEFHAEFNATQVSTLYQAVVVEGYDIVRVSFAHGQRSRNTEQLRLMVGPVEPPEKTSPNQEENLEEYGFTEVLTTNTNAVGSFQLYSDDVVVPEGSTVLYFAFQSVGEFATSSVGNFLDEVSFRGIRTASLEGLGLDIESGSSISNVIQSARIYLENAEIEDQLVIRGEIDSKFTVETNYLDGAIEMTITGEAFRHEYEAIFEQVTMSTTSEETHTRLLSVVVNDGFSVSEPAQYAIEFE